MNDGLTIAIDMISLALIVIAFIVAAVVIIWETS